MKYILILVVAVSLFVGISTVQAGPLTRARQNLGNALGDTGLSDDLPTSIGFIIKALLSLLGTVFLILTIYAGILWMTAQGNDEKTGQAKKIIESAVIGLFIVVSAYAITAFVTRKAEGIGGEEYNELPEAQTGCCINPSTNQCVSYASPGDCVLDSETWQAGECPSTCSF